MPAQLALGPALLHQASPGAECWATAAALTAALLWPLGHRASWRRWRPYVLASIPVLLACVVSTNAVHAWVPRLPKIAAAHGRDAAIVKNEQRLQPTAPRLLPRCCRAQQLLPAGSSSPAVPSRLLYLAGLGPAFQLVSLLCLCLPLR